MNDENNLQQNLDNEENQLEPRRTFLRSLGKWSQAVIGGVLLGGAFTSTASASSWFNNRNAWGSGGSWLNRPNSWSNRSGSWVNRNMGGWVNRPNNWANRSGQR